MSNVTAGTDRLPVRFDPATMSFWAAETIRRRPTNRMRVTVLHYVENQAARTPTGGRYTSRRMTVRTADGRKWWGTVNSRTDVVRLHPAGK